MAGDDNAIDLEGLQQELTEHFMGEDKEEAPPTAHDTPSSTPSATTEQTGEVDAKESNASPASSTILCATEPMSTITPRNSVGTADFG